MSALPKRTTILIKDLLFQEKYALSHTQTDLMAYLVNVSYWANVVDGYHVIATSKIMSDLPCLGEKTFEASLKVLKEFGLVQCKVVRVLHWQGKPYIRGVKLTEKGQEYNNKLILPTQDKKLRSVEKELKEALAKITILEEKEKIQKQTKEEVKGVKEEEKSQKAKPTEPKTTPTAPKKEEIDNFIEENIKYFGMTSKPICNFVPTYNKETTFYINCFNRLSMIMPNGKVHHLTNPETTNAFWQWLFLNPQRVGDKINFSKNPTIKKLKQRFINRVIEINGKKRQIIDVIEVENGVKLKIREQNGTELFIINSDTKEDMVFELENCQKVILEILKS